MENQITSQTGRTTLNCSNGKLDLFGNDATNGIAVLISSPSSLWTVEVGDVIISVGGIEVQIPEEFFAVLRAVEESSIEAIVERNGSYVSLILSVENYQACIPPPPPPPGWAFVL
jgi:hypothetical protein